MHTIFGPINSIGKGIVNIHPLSIVITSNNSQAYTRETDRKCYIIPKGISPLSTVGIL